MSINVTVNGNTLSKGKGKMVSSSNPDLEKMEFNKRRRIRLEQVRQQSKNIAESVRNKVRKEKKKQLSDFEKKGENELKKWQAKKLLALQQQYHECLKDIGLGHVQAAIEDESDEAEEIRKENYAKIAKHRGQMALDRLNNEKHQEEKEKFSSENKRKYNQAVENARAVLVANLKNKKHKGKKRRELSSDINTSGRLTAGSDTENESPKFFNLSSRCTSPSTSCSPTPRTCSPPPRPLVCSKPPRPTTCSESLSPPPKSKTCPGPCNPANAVKSTQNLEINGRQSTCKESEIVVPQVSTCAGDTRISDRIRSRTTVNVDICEVDVEKRTCSNRSKADLGSVDNPQPCVSDLVQNDNGDEEIGPACARKSDVQVIPKKPSVTLRRTIVSKEVTCNQKSACSTHLETDRSKSKTQYYDHKNRFSKEYTDDKVNIHKINQDSIEVCPSSGSEVEYKEKMYKRDRDAAMRGKKALEKVKVQKDYCEMMQQLPNLQKQEKIASIPLNNPKFHMSNDRLKEREQKNQNRMEGAYEKLFPKTCTVTIPAKPPKKTITSTLPFQTITVSEDSPTLNVASWDIDAKPEASRPKGLEPRAANNLCCKCPPPVDAENISKKETTENLQGMLKSLTNSRNKLFEELASLPEDSQLHNFLAQNGGLSSIDEVIKVSATVKDDGLSGGSGRKRSRSKVKRSPASKSSNRAESYSSSNKRSTSPDKPKSSAKLPHNYSAESSRSPSPSSEKICEDTKPEKVTKAVKATKPTKPKTSTRSPPLEPLILQNIGTQTTPRAVSDTNYEIKPAPASPKTKKSIHSPKPISESVGKDEAKSKTVSGDDGLVSTAIQAGKGDSCEIIIRIGEDGKPKICVNPVELKNKEIIVRTGLEEVVADSEVAKQLISDSNKKSDKKSTAPSGKTKRGVSKHKVRPEREEKVKEAKMQGKTTTSQTNKNKDTSWREYLSQNSNTSSTSYYSPPSQNILTGECKCLDSRTYKSIPDEEHIRMYHPQFSHLLQNKSQQGNLKMQQNIRSKSVDPSLVECIKKLLTMSRNTIDELAVSSVSDISTPSSSVVNISTNIKVHQIKDAMKRFNIDVSNINQVLNYSADESNPHYNTAESLTVSSFDSKCNCVTLSKNHDLQKSSDARNLSLDEYCSENYAGVLSTYNEMAESYSKRIENLTTMIDKLRSEKSNVLFSPSSERDSSTKYLDLPADFKSKRGGNESKNSSADEQEELNRYLLSTDYGLIEPLQIPAPVKSRKSTLSNESDELKDSIDKELKKRFDSLMSNYTAQTAPLPEVICCPNPCDDFSKNDSTKEDVPFVPLLLDIPRLPKLEGYSEQDNCLCKPLDKSKPPISKGLVSAKRFNNDINLVPHELSTIAETELSNRNLRTPEKSTRNKSTTPNAMAALKPFVILPQPEVCQSKPIDIVDVSRRSSTGQHSTKSTSYNSLSDISNEASKSSIGSKKSKNKSLTSAENPYKQEHTIMFEGIVPKAVAEATSDSSVDELENMENMLKSLGMGWAISTLRKTQETLNLQSSSSSLDISLKKSIKLTESNSSSDISFRDILSKQFLTKLSSSSIKSDDSSTLSPYLNQFQNMTLIQNSDGSQERTTQRTSTPIQSNRTTDKSKSDSQPNVILSAESELSSIKEHLHLSDEQRFYSLVDDTTLTKNESNND